MRSDEVDDDSEDLQREAALEQLMVQTRLQARTPHIQQQDTSASNAAMLPDHLK